MNRTEFEEIILPEMVEKAGPKKPSGQTIRWGLVALVTFLTVLIAALKLSQSQAYLSEERAGDVARRLANDALSAAVDQLHRVDGSPGFLMMTRPLWLKAGEGETCYRASYDSKRRLYTVRAWGRVAVAPGAAEQMTVAPDTRHWEGEGWITRGLEATLRTRLFVPRAPLVLGNGALERPLGGREWGRGRVRCAPSSWQTSNVPMEVSALDHPADHLATGAGPLPFLGRPHPYPLVQTQTRAGQQNVTAWFEHSAGMGNAAGGLTPPPDGRHYDGTPESGDHFYLLSNDFPNLEGWVEAIHARSTANGEAASLSAGSHDGVYGSPESPALVVCTGGLNIPTGRTLKGHGILMVRDASSGDRPRRSRDHAGIDVSGILEWTGLVVVVGDRPRIRVRSVAGARARINGALLATDRRASGGEESLDEAGVCFQIENPLRITYSRSLFQPGSWIYERLPHLGLTIVRVREL